MFNNSEFVFFCSASEIGESPSMQCSFLISNDAQISYNFVITTEYNIFYQKIQLLKIIRVYYKYKRNLITVDSKYYAAAEVNSFIISFRSAISPIVNPFSTLLNLFLLA